MKNRIGKFLAASIFLLLLWFSFAATPTPTITPTPTPNAREVLILRIQQSAQKDVEQDAVRQSTSELQALFGNDATSVGLSLNEVKDIYNAAYQAAKPIKSPWADLITLQNGGWLVAGVLFILFILRDIIKNYLEKLFKKIAEAAYQQLARFRPFWWIALRRYRRSLERNFRELKIPFRPERPLLMKDVYVPLRGQGADRKSVGIFEVLQQQRKLVILGDPGSGKTMFLRHIAFHYAQKELNDFPGSPIPIYLELNRLKVDDASLMASLTKALENNKFPGAGEFLKAHLENKDLLILLDGLDEVDIASRPDIVRQIKDLTQTYPENRILITCRKAVYQAEFSDWNDQELEIIDFNDQQIQQFMTSWQKDMPPDKSIEHFLRSLQERPQIMALARNPLLLTMIAYLYTDTEFALPHSRSEFYSRSTNLLLDQWKLERNHYKAAQKRLVLQHLALFSQEQAKQTGERRIMELTDVLDEVQRVLPDLTLEVKDAQPLLDEIVQRSGLMLSIDGGLRYQFTHLTLQEYFAACALESRAETLLENFRTNPDTWREVLRLWCSLEHDCTNMLKEIYVIDTLMALECLSDAQKVETTYADELLTSLKPRLVEATTNEALANAFALLAADPRKRGQDWFNFLRNSLNDSQLRQAACLVLAHTNLPQAAVALARIESSEPTTKQFLVRLGNLAVPALAEVAQNGDVWALDALAEIGTPQAVLILQNFLWTDERPAYAAAWHIAALLYLPGVEDALRSISLSAQQRKMAQINWVWEPFKEPNTSNIPVITGRIALLLYTTPKTFLPEKISACDLRLAIPLCTIFAKLPSLSKEIKQDIKRMLSLAVESKGENINWAPGLLQTFDYPLAKQPALQHLFSTLSRIEQCKIWTALINEKTQPSADDWRNLYKPVKYAFENSFHEKTFKLLFLTLVILNFWGIWIQVAQSPMLIDWPDLGALSIGIILLILLIWIFRRKSSRNVLDIFLVLTVFGSPGLVAIIVEKSASNWIIGGIIGMLVGSIYSGTVIGVSIYSQKNVEKRQIGYVLWHTFCCVLIGIIFKFFGINVGLNLLICLAFSVCSGLFITLTNLVDRTDMRKFATLMVASLLYLIAMILTEIIGKYPTQILYNLVGWLGLTIFWLSWLGGLTFLSYISVIFERRAQNCLHGILDDTSSSHMISSNPLGSTWQLRWKITRDQLIATFFPHNNSYR